MILKKISFILVSLFIITSCAISSKISKSSKPSWLTTLSGYTDGGLVATGCAGMHIKGFNAQKQLATERAISSLAMQKSTSVKTISNTSEKRNKGVLSSSKYSSSSQYQTNTNVSFKRQKEYYDELNKEYCVLIGQ